MFAGSRARAGGGGLWKVSTNDVRGFVSTCSMLGHILVLRALDIWSCLLFTATFWGSTGCILGEVAL